MELSLVTTPFGYCSICAIFRCVPLLSVSLAAAEKSGCGVGPFCVLFRLFFCVLEMLEELRVFCCAILNFIFELLIELEEAPEGPAVWAAC